MNSAFYTIPLSRSVSWQKLWLVAALGLVGCDLAGIENRIRESATQSPPVDTRGLANYTTSDQQRQWDLQDRTLTQEQEIAERNFQLAMAEIAVKELNAQSAIDFRGGEGNTVSIATIKARSATETAAIGADKDKDVARQRREQARETAAINRDAAAEQARAKLEEALGESFIDGLATLGGAVLQGQSAERAAEIEARAMERANRSAQDRQAVSTATRSLANLRSQEERALDRERNQAERIGNLANYAPGQKIPPSAVDGNTAAALGLEAEYADNGALAGYKVTEETQRRAQALAQSYADRLKAREGRLADIQNEARAVDADIAVAHSYNEEEMRERLATAHPLDHPTAEPGEPTAEAFESGIQQRAENLTALGLTTNSTLSNEDLAERVRKKELYEAMADAGVEGMEPVSEGLTNRDFENQNLMGGFDSAATQELNNLGVPRNTSVTALDYAGLKSAQAKLNGFKAAAPVGARSFDGLTPYELAGMTPVQQDAAIRRRALAAGMTDDEIDAALNSNTPPTNFEEFDGYNCARAAPSASVLQGSGCEDIVKVMGLIGPLSQELENLNQLLEAQNGGATKVKQGDSEIAIANAITDLRGSIAEKARQIKDANGPSNSSDNAVLAKIQEIVARAAAAAKDGKADGKDIQLLKADKFRDWIRHYDSDSTTMVGKMMDDADRIFNNTDYVATASFNPGIVADTPATCEFPGDACNFGRVEGPVQILR